MFFSKSVGKYCTYYEAMRLPIGLPSRFPMVDFWPRCRAPEGKNLKSIFLRAYRSTRWLSCNPSFSGGTALREINQGFSRVKVRPAGRVRSFSKTHGSSQVGSGDVRNLTGRVGSNQEGFEYHGSGRVTLTRTDPTRPAKSNPTHEKPWN